MSSLTAGADISASLRISSPEGMQFSEQRWFFWDRPQGERTPWLVVLIEFLAVYGFLPGWLVPGMTARVLVSRFRTFFLRLCKGLPTSIHSVKHVKSAAVFGVKSLSGFYGSMRCQHINHQIFIFLQASHAQSVRLPDRKSPGHKWTPKFDGFDGIPPY